MPLKIPGRDRARKVPPELGGVDFGTTGLKIVRVRNNRGVLELLGAAIFPPLEMPSEPTGHNVRFKPPKNLLTNYVTITIPGRTAVIRLLALGANVAPAELTEAKVREQIGIGPEYRIAWSVLPAIKGRTENRILVVGVPEKEIKTVLSLVPSGPPAPYSVEVAGLAALTSFEQGPGRDTELEGAIVIEGGEQTTLMAVYARRNLVLIRKFDFGGETILARVQQQLGVDRETAQGIVADGSFDISQPVHEVMDPFLRQLTISRDFVERREECAVQAIFLSGGVTQSRYWAQELHEATGLEIVTWNPFESFQRTEQNLPAELAAQGPRFTAAVGSILGVYSEG